MGVALGHKHVAALVETDFMGHAKARCLGQAAIAAMAFFARACHDEDLAAAQLQHTVAPEVSPTERSIRGAFHAKGLIYVCGGSGVPVMSYALHARAHYRENSLRRGEGRARRN